MKLNLIYFSDFNLKLNLYKKDKMDWFLFIILNIFNDEKIDKNYYVKDILSKLYIPDDMYYLFSNAYYKLLDNNLIEGIEKEFDKLQKKDFIVTDLGKYCFANNIFPMFYKSLDYNLILNIIEQKIMSKNDFDYNNIDNNIVIDELYKTEDLNDFVNKNIRKLLPGEDESIITKINIKNINPLLLNVNAIFEKGMYILDYKNKTKNLIELIIKNFVYLNFDNDFQYNDNYKVLTNNYFYKILVGNSEILKINSNFYFIIDDSKAFEIFENIIYIPSDFKIKFNYMGCIENKFYNTNYYVSKFENDYFIPLIKEEKISTFEFKKYISDNLEEFNDKNLVEKILKIL